MIVMIPKIIHYCWFGGNELPVLAMRCIESWKKYLPDYEIKEWNETNYDVHFIPYVHEAYESKKYAFVSDYVRFDILYRYGGLYFDTDVEVIKPMNDIIARGPFMGCETDINDRGATAKAVAPGLGMGVNPGLGIYSEILDLYGKLHFVKADGSLNLKTVVEYTTELLCKHGLKNTNEIQKCVGVWIYPARYFCPINLVTKKIHITEDTCTIHHYAASWIDKKENKLKSFLRNMLPEWVLLLYNKLSNII